MHTLNASLAGDPFTEVESYRVEVIGFSPIERTVFVSTFALSQRRRIRYAQHVGGMGPSDLLLVNSDDPAALVAHGQHALRDVVPTILVGEGGNDMMGWRLHRPIKWMALFDLLDEAVTRSLDGRSLQPGLHPDAPHALVVTASAEVARTVDAHLVSAGCHVLQVHDGEEAIGKLSTMPYACVFVNVALPGIGGLEVARIAKARSAYRVIVMGATGTPLERMRASMAGCDAYLSPPLDGQLLVQAIERCMR